MYLMPLTLDIQTGLEISADVYLDALPTERRYFVVKPWNYGLYVDATNWGAVAIQAGGGVGADEELNPDANGHDIDLTPVGVANNWDCVNDAAPLGGDDASYVEHNAGTGWATHEFDYYTLDDTALTDDDGVDDITVFFRVYDGAAGDATHYKPHLYLYGNDTAGTEVFNGAPVGGWDDYNEVLGRPGGGDWKLSDLNDLEVGIEMWGTIAAQRCSEIYVMVGNTDYTEFVAESAASIETDVTLSATYDGVNLKFYEDGVLKDTTAVGGNLATSAYDLAIGEVDARIDNVVVTDTAVDVLDLTFEGDEISTTTITDGSASSNDVTYSLYTDACVTAALGSMSCGSEGSLSTTGIAPTGSIDVAKDLNLPDLAGVEETARGVDDTSLPGLMVGYLEDTTGVQANWIWWYIFGSVCVLLFVHVIRIRGVSPIYGWVAVLIATALFVDWEIIPWFFLLFYGAAAVGIGAWRSRSSI